MASAGPTIRLTMLKAVRKSGVLMARCRALSFSVQVMGVSLAAVVMRRGGQEFPHFVPAAASPPGTRPAPPASRAGGRAAIRPDSRMRATSRYRSASRAGSASALRRRARLLGFPAAEGVLFAEPAVPGLGVGRAAGHPGQPFAHQQEGRSGQVQGPAQVAAAQFAARAAGGHDALKAEAAGHVQLNGPGPGAPDGPNATRAGPVQGSAAEAPAFPGAMTGPSRTASGQPARGTKLSTRPVSSRPPDSSRWFTVRGAPRLLQTVIPAPLPGEGRLERLQHLEQVVEIPGHEQLGLHPGDVEILLHAGQGKGHLFHRAGEAVAGFAGWS